MDNFILMIKIINQKVLFHLTTRSA